MAAIAKPQTSRPEFVRVAPIHWPEYLMEAAGLGIFMISACLFSVLIFHHSSPVVDIVPSETARLALMGLAMGLTNVGLIYSPWGKQSGAHFNPCVTLTFLRLGKINKRDATFYILSQTAGGAVGVIVLIPFLGSHLRDSAVNFAVTIPGDPGVAAAWVVEFAISFILMTTVLVVSNRSSIADKTGWVAGSLVALNIFFAAPISGMSMNPARTLATALPAGIWNSVWVYFTAPLIAMLLAAECYVWIRGRQAVFCAKLHHQNKKRCIFCESRADQNVLSNL